METITFDNIEVLMKEHLQDLYDESKIWLSETEFWSDELKFLQTIYAQYFSDMTTTHKLGELEFFEKKLLSTSNKVEKLQGKIKQQLKQVFEIIENAFSHDEYAFRERHTALKQELKTVQTEIKELKRRVFSFTEEVMKKKKSHEKIFIW